MANERMDRGRADVEVAEKVWDATFANYPNYNDPHLRLLAVFKREFVSWVTGLGEPGQAPVSSSSTQQPPSPGICVFTISALND